MSYALHILILFDIYVVVALSLNIIVGYVGLLTLAHAGYFAIGGYAYALAGYILGWEWGTDELCGLNDSSDLCGQRLEVNFDWAGELSGVGGEDDGVKGG